jgi:hypothetical protein
MHLAHFCTTDTEETFNTHIIEACLQPSWDCAANSPISSYINAVSSSLEASKYYTKCLGCNQIRRMIPLSLIGHWSVDNDEFCYGCERLKPPGFIRARVILQYSTNCYLNVDLSCSFIACKLCSSARTRGCQSSLLVLVGSESQDRRKYASFECVLCAMRKKGKPLKVESTEPTVWTEAPIDYAVRSPTPRPLILGRRPAKPVFKGRLDKRSNSHRVKCPDCDQYVLLDLLFKHCVKKHRKIPKVGDLAHEFPPAPEVLEQLKPLMDLLRTLEES